MSTTQRNASEAKASQQSRVGISDGGAAPAQEPKTKPTSKEEASPFVRDKLFPDTEAIFGFVPQPLTAVRENAVFVLDASVLLLPYSTGKLALQEIKKVYSRLAQDARLIVPHQAAREFAAHRLEKIAKLYGETQQWRQSLQNVEMHASPSLDLLSEYEQYQKARAEADKQIGECRSALTGIQKKLLGWYHNDPVLAIYRDLFKGAILFGPTKTTDELTQDNEYRNRHMIPPGCAKEDVSKPDRGIGDKIIWHTILRVASERNCHAVFVTQDITKGDWVHCHHGPKESKGVLFPRCELTDEYRRASNGQTFHIIELSDLLKLFEAAEEAVSTVRGAEEVARLNADPELTRRLRRLLSKSSRSFRWLRDEAGIDLSDDEFSQLIAVCPDFRSARIIRRDETGQRIVPGAPGIALARRPKLFL